MYIQLGNYNQFVSDLSVTRGGTGTLRPDQIRSRQAAATATATRTYTREIKKLIRGPRKPIDQKRTSTALHVSENLCLKQIHDQADGTELALVHGLLHDVPDAEGAGVLELTQHFPRAEVDQAQIFGQTRTERAFARAGAAWILIMLSVRLWDALFRVMNVAAGGRDVSRYSPMTKMISASAKSLSGWISPAIITQTSICPV